MAQLKNKFVDLPDGWKFLVKETGFMVEGNSFNELFDLTVYHMSINNIPVPDDLAQIIEERLCETAPKKLVTER